jgi:hypothetical protein
MLKISLHLGMPITDSYPSLGRTDVGFDMLKDWYSIPVRDQRVFITFSRISQKKRRRQ